MCWYSYCCALFAKMLPAAATLAWLGLALALPAGAAPQDFNHRKLAETAKTQLIIPGYQRFGASLSDLRTSISQLCASPGQKALRATRDAYREVIAAWGRIEIINFGPVAEANRFDRIFYWPDRKGRGRRQVLRLLKVRPQNALSAISLAKKSIAVQGLTALEVVLFGKTSELLLKSSNRDYSCRYADAIVDNLSSINEAILEAWTSETGFARLWANPSQNNSIYLSDIETTLELVKALDIGIENVRDKRIGPILGFGPKRLKSRPILWRSKSSMALIHANIAGLHKLLFKAGLAEVFIESRPDDNTVARYYMTSARKEFDMALDIAKELLAHPDPLPGRKVEAQIANRLSNIGFHLKKIRINNVPEIKRAAGLVVGFNASDGD